MPSTVRQTLCILAAAVAVVPVASLVGSRRAIAADLPQVTEDDPIEVADGEGARPKLAERARQRISRSTNRDLSELSDSESLDLIEYMLGRE